MNSTFYVDGFLDASRGVPPSPPSAPWPDFEQVIRNEYADGYIRGLEEKKEAA